MFCAQCGSQNPDESKFCKGCGGRIAVDQMEAGVQPPQTPQPATTVEPDVPVIQPTAMSQASAAPTAPAAPAPPQAANAPRPGVTLVGAGAGRRFFAVLIDLILFGAAVFFLYQQFGTGGLALDTGGMDIKKLTLDYDNWYLYYSTMTDFLYVLVPLLGGILYVIAFEGAFGWTLGKLIMGVRVVKTDGRRSGFLAAVLRLIFWVIDVFLIGLIMVLVTKRKQRLGDMVAGTVVAGRKAVKASRRGAAAD